MVQKKWGKPEILIVSRSKPEEYVLESCKNSTITGGLGATYGTCNNKPSGGSGQCQASKCNTVVNS